MESDKRRIAKWVTPVFVALPFVSGIAYERLMDTDNLGLSMFIAESMQYIEGPAGKAAL